MWQVLIVTFNDSKMVLRSNPSLVAFLYAVCIVFSVSLWAPPSAPVFPTLKNTYAGLHLVKGTDKDLNLAQRHHTAATHCSF